MVEKLHLLGYSGTSIYSISSGRSY